MVNIGSMARAIPVLSRMPLPGDPKLWTSGDLVHRPPDPMADVLAYHAVAVGPSGLLHGVADVTEPVAGDRLGDAVPQGLLGDLEQGGHLGWDGADGHGECGVGVPPLVDGPGVDRQDVALPKPVVPRDAVDDGGVRRGADAGRVTVVAEERGTASVVADHRGGHGVEVGGGDPGHRGVPHRGVGGRHATTGDDHLLEVGRRLPGDHLAHRRAVPSCGAVAVPVSVRRRVR